MQLPGGQHGARVKEASYPARPYSGGTSSPSHWPPGWIQIQKVPESGFPSPGSVDHSQTPAPLCRNSQTVRTPIRVCIWPPLLQDRPYTMFRQIGSQNPPLLSWDASTLLCASSGAPQRLRMVRSAGMVLRM